MRNIYKSIVFALGAVMLLVLATAHNVTSAFAGVSCRSGYVYSEIQSDCIKRVQDGIRQQDANAAGGKKWGPANKKNCNAASNEMDRSMAKCRKLDYKPGGKVAEDCALCCRQLREGARRWNACNQAGFAPPVDWVTINASKARLHCDW